MMEDFSGLALPPLFGGHILEAELETGGVELGPGGTELLETDGAPSGSGDEERRELDKNKYQTLSRRCKEIQQVNEKILGRLHQVQRLTRRMRKERRFLMKTLDSYGDDYRAAQLTITLEEEGKAVDSALGGDEDVSSPTFPPQSTGGAAGDDGGSVQWIPQSKLTLSLIPEQQKQHLQHEVSHCGTFVLYTTG